MAAYLSCKNTVMQIYQDVINDVVSNTCEQFIEEGVEEQILLNLKQTWEAKLKTNQAVKNSQIEVNSAITKPDPFKMQQQHLVSTQQTQVQSQLLKVSGNAMVPIQIMLPGQNNTLKIQVPASSLKNNNLQKVITGTLVSTLMNLPQPIASLILQQHVNASLNSQSEIYSAAQKDGTI